MHKDKKVFGFGTFPLSSSARAARLAGRALSGRSATGSITGIVLDPSERWFLTRKSP